MNFIKSFDDKKIVYTWQSKDTNSKNQKTLVFIHGLGGSPNALIPLIKKVSALLPNYQIIFYELRGHGRSSKTFPKDAKDFVSTHARDLQQLCLNLKLNSPIFLGHSLGGLVIQEYLNQQLNPLPQKKVLICTMTKTPNLSISNKFWFSLLKKLPQLQKEITSRPVDFYLQFQNGHDINLKRLYADTKVVGGLKRWLILLASLFGYENSNLENLDQEDTLFIIGKKDWFVDERGELKRLKKLEKINLEFINSNHISPLTNTENLAQVINNFIIKN
ncbi:MAG: alpha/beta hydrolase [Candidatus Woesebacteria bacterium]|jgi:pimeloyl-ACP methyl ester carboxylesterase